jgi:uncharacterized protein YdeI (YjbR/CyaY-like superfamily)
MEMPKSLEEFWKVNEHHSKQLQTLRSIIIECGLEETYKWAFPTYTFKGKNLISIASFKHHYGIWFFQGVFLNDDAKVLTNAQEGKTKAMRQWRVESADPIELDLLKTYVFEAIDNCKAGKEIKVVRDTSYNLPIELENYLNTNPSLNEAFYSLSPGRQKEYANYISNATQETTKLKRIDKITPLVLCGKGLNDKYR